MSRSVIFDTETTGLDPATGDRVIEIACIELHRDLPTGNTFHALIDPERDIPEEATRVHGIRAPSAAGQTPLRRDGRRVPRVHRGLAADRAQRAIRFRLPQRRARRADRAPLDLSRMIDTLELAKARFPGLPNSLDSLCRRYDIDLSERTSHNALLDCRLLSDVYVELTGGRQSALMLLDEAAARCRPSPIRPIADRPPILIKVDAGDPGATRRLPRPPQGAGLAHPMSPE